jgi:hypothetical protein
LIHINDRVSGGKHFSNRSDTARRFKPAKRYRKFYGASR